MPDCPVCDHRLSRVRRNPLQKLAYREIFRCANCGYRSRLLYPIVRVHLIFCFSRHTHCIQCGSSRVKRVPRLDRVDGISMHPLSLMFRLLGAPIVHCPACRLQYYDWRQPLPMSQSVADREYV